MEESLKRCFCQIMEWLDEALAKTNVDVQDEVACLDRPIEKNEPNMSWQRLIECSTISKSCTNCGMWEYNTYTRSDTRQIGAFVIISFIKHY